MQRSLPEPLDSRNTAERPRGLSFNIRADCGAYNKGGDSN